VQVDAHKLVTGLSRKADGVITLCFGAEMTAEILLLETSLPKATKHQADDRSKLGRCLKSCAMNLVAQIGDVSLLKDLALFGIQTIGKSRHFDNWI
jgi:hypothetical protein